MSSMTTLNFAGYKAIVFGDPGCTGEPPAILAATKSAWGAAITGNVLLYGGDPSLHSKPNVVKSFIKFAAGGRTGTTGLYVALSCYAEDKVGFLSVLGSAATGYITAVDGNYDSAAITATHPALEGLTEGALSGWGPAAVSAGAS